MKYMAENYIRNLEREDEAFETIITKSPSLTPRALIFSEFLISLPLYSNCCCCSGTCVCSISVQLSQSSHKEINKINNNQD